MPHNRFQKQDRVLRLPRWQLAIPLITMVFLMNAPLLSAQTGLAQSQFIMMGGAFSPNDDAVDQIYGTGGMARVALGIGLGEHGQITLGAGWFRKHGDPFHQAPDFNGEDASVLNMIPLSLSIGARGGYAGRAALLIGGGFDFLLVNEEIRGNDRASGSTIGLHASIQPEIALSHSLALALEGRYQWATVNLKNDAGRYDFDLSGPSLMAGLSYRFR